MIYDISVDVFAKCIVDDGEIVVDITGYMPSGKLTSYLRMCAFVCVRVCVSWNVLVSHIRLLCHMWSQCH